MHVFHCVPTLHPQAGGPSRTVVQLADALAGNGSTEVAIVTQSLQGQPLVMSRCERVVRLVASSKSVSLLRFGLPLRSELNAAVRPGSSAIIHSHGLWHPANHWAARFARRRGLPLVVHPRGMLEPWALSHKGWKKSLALTLFQRNDLNRARVLIATSPEECRNIRLVGLTPPIAVIPNGVELEVNSCREQKSLAPARMRKVLFLSRVHQKKGLLNLVEAWAQIRPQGWLLQIAGPDEGGHLVEVLAAARSRRVDDAIEYLGEVDGVEKSAAYTNADLFVLPTYSENFGVVVAEALAHGLPVITTKGAPWSDLERHYCGWWIEIGVAPLAAALQTAMALSDDERRQMGERGRHYVQRYKWADIAGQMMAVYRWVLDGGAPPACIVTD